MLSQTARVKYKNVATTHSSQYFRPGNAAVVLTGISHDSRKEFAVRRGGQVRRARSDEFIKLNCST